MRASPEHRLRLLWLHRLFPPSTLATTDGRRVIVLDPGRPNADGGPDVSGARLQIGTVFYRGSIEFHARTGEWIRHGHHLDPHYNGVVLHIVGRHGPAGFTTKTSSGRSIPVLVLPDDLALPRSLPPAFGHIPRPRCIAHLSDTSCRSLLLRRGVTRIGRRTRLLEARLLELLDEESLSAHEPRYQYEGYPDDLFFPERRLSDSARTCIPAWEQLLFEAIMEALGYAKNSSAFLALARSMRLRLLRGLGLHDTTTMMAALLGAAGLLPSSRGLPEKESRVKVRTLRRRWKLLRPSLRVSLLHEADWLFMRLRPVNFPTARLASMAFLLPSLFGADSFGWFVRCFQHSPVQYKEIWKECRIRFSFTPDLFWSHHVHFRGHAAPRGVRLGAARLREILANAILPVMLLYAQICKDSAVRHSAHALLAHLAAGPPSARLRSWLQENGVRAGRRSLVIEQGLLELTLEGEVRLEEKPGLLRRAAMPVALRLEKTIRSRR